MEFAIEPGAFGNILRNGGRENKNKVTGIWYQAGKTFKASGKNFILGTFQQ
jgi:hypothetical protein